MTASAVLGASVLAQVEDCSPPAQQVASSLQRRTGISAGKDAKNWEEDVDMYGGDTSTSAALLARLETPPTNAEKKQEARRMKQQAAGDRMQRMSGGRAGWDRDRRRRWFVCGS